MTAIKSSVPLSPVSRTFKISRSGDRNKIIAVKLPITGNTVPEQYKKLFSDYVAIKMLSRRLSQNTLKNTTKIEHKL